MYQKLTLQQSASTQGWQIVNVKRYGKGMFFLIQILIVYIL